jgi:hypothetical protein
MIFHGLRQVSDEKGQKSEIIRAFSVVFCLSFSRTEHQAPPVRYSILLLLALRHHHWIRSELDKFCFHPKELSHCPADSAILHRRDFRHVA